MTEFTRLSAGATPPNFRLTSHADQEFTLDQVVGVPLVLLFYLQDGAPDCTRELCAFRDLHEEFEKLNTRIIAVGVDSVESHKAFAEQHQLPFPLLADVDGKVSATFGAATAAEVDGTPQLSLSRRTLLFGPDVRVAKIYDNIDPATHAAEVLEDLRKRVLREEPRQLVQFAPVLMIPNVLPPELCQQLIRIWENEGNEESGFMKQIDGKTVGLTDYSHKIRRDHYLRTGSDAEEQLKGYMAARVIPEIRKAFNYNVSRKEDFRIACYDSTRGGYFRPHRDNTTDGTAHRRFAMSLMLNDDYEGGYLRFPEYGRHRYRPEAGSAVIFSCSLLHEATDVTSGRRFVLLSFFYGEQEAKMREEYSRRTGGGYRR